MTKIDRNPVVSAIVVTHDCAENVIPCLRAIKENLGGVNGEILVFDNSSFDSTVSSIKSKFTDINIFLSPENVGFAAANNKMSSIARGEYILFANPDMILDKGALLSMLAVFKKYPMAGAVVARMRYPDGSFQPTCRKFPDTRNIFFSRGSVISLIKQSSNGDEHYTIGDSDQITEVPAASATCMLVD
ncbi:MAG: glycosyltransferase, partial [candidate division Zixibacteria bacterium]|nr:glycosyltransferase [candidate division Zixibacteria bacterium]